ncbi:hypothetical protein DL98DRAFT_566609 [Cadophora sp. DSE1049]|nr:hypothetical protein DL98DRAFT_566609 [Cadophora sp. DSE1049]
MAQKIDHDVEDDITMANNHAVVEHENDAMEIEGGQVVLARSERVTLDVYIWYLVFEVGKILLRLQDVILKAFDAILTPRVFERISIQTQDMMQTILDTERLLGSRIKENIIKHTKSLIVDVEQNDQNHMSIAGLVEKGQVLLSFGWEYFPDEYLEPWGCPKEIRAYRRRTSRLVAAYIKAFLSNPASSTHQEIVMEVEGQTWYLHAQTTAPKPGVSKYYGHELTLGNGLVLEDAILEHVGIVGDNGLDSLSIPLVYGEMKWPPMRSLKLEKYEWNVSKDDVPRIFDFRQLQRLNFHNAGLDNFAYTVSAASLNNLRSCAFSWTITSMFEERKLVKRFMASVLESCGSLNTLEIECDFWEQLIPLNSLRVLGRKLWKLTLKVASEWATRTMTPAMLEDILAGCPNIVELHIDIVAKEELLPRYLNALSRAGSLRELTLGTIQDISVGVTDDMDQDYEGAKQIMTTLHLKGVKSLSRQSLSASGPPS